MRARKETGDFEIVLTSDNSYTAKLNNRVSAEDLIGYIAKVDGTYYIITEAVDSNDKKSATVKINDVTYLYTREDAKLTKAVGAAG